MVPPAMGEASPANGSYGITGSGDGREQPWEGYFLKLDVLVRRVPEVFVFGGDDAEVVSGSGGGVPASSCMGLGWPLAGSFVHLCALPAPLPEAALAHSRHDREEAAMSITCCSLAMLSAASIARRIFARAFVRMASQLALPRPVCSARPTARASSRGRRFPGPSSVALDAAMSAIICSMCGSNCSTIIPSISGGVVRML